MNWYTSFGAHYYISFDMERIQILGNKLSDIEVLSSSDIYFKRKVCIYIFANKVMFC